MPENSSPDALEWIVLAAAGLSTLLFWTAVAYWTDRELRGPLAPAPAAYPPDDAA